MTQPTPYARSYSFVAFQSGHPSTPHPGDRLDEQFDAVASATSQIIDRIKLLQRDDLQVANSVIGYDQLKPELRNGMSTPTAWAAGTAYALGDGVFIDNRGYICVEAHTSVAFAGDLAAGKWSMTVDFSAVAETDADAEASAAAAAVSAAEALAFRDSTEGYKSDAETAATSASASAADAAASAASVAIGVTIQAYSANLDAWSALATSAKQDASANLDTLAGITPGAAGQAILADVTAQDVRDFLGIERELVRVADGAEIAAAISGKTNPLLIRLAKNGTYSVTARVDPPNGSLVDLNGSTCTIAASMSHFIKFADNASNVGVINGKIIVGRQTSTSPNHGWIYSLNANGSGLNGDSEAAVIGGEGTQDFLISGVEIEGVNARGVSFWASSTRPVKNGRIKVYAHSPQDNGGTAYGPGNFVFVRAGPDGYANSPENVHVVDTELWGIDPADHDPTDPATNIDVYAHTNARSGDLCVIQNGLKCKFIRVKAFYSGEVGMDFTIGARYCDMIDCTSKYNNRDGAFIGGGFSWLQMSQAHAQSFTAGNAVTGGTSATTASVFVSGIQDLSGDWWVLCTNTSGGTYWQVGETVTEDGAPTGSGTVLAVRHAAENCHVIGGAFNDNMHDEGGVVSGAGGGIKIQDGYYCEVHGADLTSKMGVSHTNSAGLYIASSTGVGYANNQYGGLLYPVILQGTLTTERFFDTDFFVGKTADQVRTSAAAYANDTHLAFGMARNATYEIITTLYVTSTVADFRYSFNTIGGSAATMFVERDAVGEVDVGYATDQTVTANASEFCVKATLKATAPATGDDATPRWSQSVSDAAATTVKKGSNMRIRRVT